MADLEGNSQRNDEVDKCEGDGWGEEVGSNAVEVHLHNLRRKLGPETIRNVRGAGYKVAA